MSRVELKTHYSAAELASMKLPGLPESERGLQLAASRNAWESRKRKGRGGGQEYAITSLPLEAINTIKNRAAADAHISQLMDPKAIPAKATNLKVPSTQIGLLDAEARRESDQAVLLKLPSLTVKQVARFEARRAVVMAWYGFLKLRGMKPTNALYEAFVSHFNAGHLQANKVQYPELALATSGVITSIALRTLQLWVSDYEKVGLAAFVDGNDGAHRKGKCTISVQKDLHDFTVAMVVANPHIKPVHLEDAAKARFDGHAAIKVPSYHAFRRFLNEWKKQNAELFTAIANPDQWKNSFMVAQGSSSEDVLRLNQRWEFDSTPADLMLADGRHCLLGVIDVWSRRGKLLVAKSSRAVGVGALVRAALLDWGKCEEAKTDNGQEYVGVYVDDVFRALDIEQTKCPPFQPWHKPHIEHFFHTFSHDLLELLPGYIGHNVTDRKAIEARKAFSERLFTKNEVVDMTMTAAELQAFCDDWLVRYHNRDHGSLDMSPFQKAASWTGSVELIDNPRLLDVLLAERIQRTVQKKGLKIDDAWFIAPELAVNLVGRDVQVRLDPLDLGRVYVFHDGQFICVAECPERTGMNRQEVAQKAKKMQAAEVSRQKRELKTMARKVNTDDVVQEILRHNAAQAGTLVAMPKPTSPVNTAGTRAAAAATNAVDRGMHAQIPAAVQRHLGQSTPAPVISLPQSDETKFRQWLELDAMAKSGQALPAEKVKFYEGWQKTARFKVQMQKYLQRSTQDIALAGNH